MPVRKRIESLVSSAKGLLGRGPNNQDEFGGVMVEPSKFPPKVTELLSTIFSSLDINAEGLLGAEGLARLNIGQDTASHSGSSSPAASLSLDQFLRACAPLVEGVDPADPDSVSCTCAELTQFFDTSRTPAHIEAIDFPLPVLDALAVALPQVFPAEALTMLCPVVSGMVPKMGTKSEFQLETEAEQRRRIDHIAQLIGCSPAKLIQCAPLAVSDPQLPNSPEGVPSPRSITSNASNPLFNESTAELSPANRPAHRWLQIWEPLVSKFDHAAPCEETPLTPRAGEQEVCDGTAACVLEIQRIANWHPVEVLSPRSGAEVLKQINRLKTKLREVTMFKKRRSDLTGKYSIVQKQETKMAQLQSLRMQIETDPSAIKKQELEASQKRLRDQMQQVEAEQAKLHDMANERAQKTTDQLKAKLQKALAASAAAGLMSPRGQAGEELAMVTAAVTHKMGECLSEEVAKLEAEESLAAERLSEIGEALRGESHRNAQSSDSEEDQEDENELQAKADAGPDGVVLDLDINPCAKPSKSRGSTDPTADVQVVCDHLAAVTLECRELHDTLREKLVNRVEAGCRAGDGLAMLLWSEVLWLMCRSRGVGKVAVGDGSISPDRAGLSHEDLLLIVETRLAPATSYARQLLGLMIEMQLQMPLFECVEEDALSFVDENGAVAEDCESGEAQRAEDELFKHVHATGAEAVQAHSVKLNGMVDQLQAKMADREAQKEVPMSAQEVKQAASKLDKEIVKMEKAIVKQRKTLDKQWSVLVSECGHETAEGLKDLETSLQFELEEFEQQEPENYVPIASLR